jgi:hypothetical protein
MKTTEIVVVNRLDSGTSFGVTLDEPAESVFIPARVAEAAKAEVGDRFIALLVPNTIQPDRTPWMAARIDTALPLPQVDGPAALASTADRVRATMLAGGVWTLGEMFEDLFPGASRGASLQDYNAISAALRAMYAKGECAKFQLWRSADQTKPGREWFTCYPERADVDEWEGG